MTSAMQLGIFKKKATGTVKILWPYKNNEHCTQCIVLKRILHPQIYLALPQYLHLAASDCCMILRYLSTELRPDLQERTWGLSYWSCYKYSLLAWNMLLFRLMPIIYVCSGSNCWDWHTTFCYRETAYSEDFWVKNPHSITSFLLCFVFALNIPPSNSTKINYLKCIYHMVITIVSLQNINPLNAMWIEPHKRYPTEGLMYAAILLIFLWCKTFFTLSSFHDLDSHWFFL